LEDSALESEAVVRVELEVSGWLASIHVFRGVYEVPKWTYFMNSSARINVGFVIRVDYMTRSVDVMLTYARDTGLQPSILARYGSPGLSFASGFEHPASTLQTRFPAALGIGHGHACGLANACALVYVAA